MRDEVDVVVVGAGNAAMCAAVSAMEHGASVLLLERAPYGEHGGNTAFTAGAMRVAYRGAEDILALATDLPASLAEATDFGKYDTDDFIDDLARVTGYRADPDLAQVLVEESYPTLSWMKEKGVKFEPIYGRQAFKVDGRFTFWGGLTLETAGGGLGLIDALSKAVEGAGGTIEYGARAMRLVEDDEGRICGVVVRQGGRTRTISTRAVVLACGGFQSNSEWRTRYLGPGWDLAKVRGTRFNTGDGIRMALELGAQPWGNWSGAHAVAWEFNAPPFGDRVIGDGFQKHSYPFSVIVNAAGQRFVNEGEDFRNYTYAKYGRVILEQPGQIAWQVFDSKVTHLLRDEYRIRQVTRARADTLQELAQKMEGMDVQAFLKTMDEYNSAVDLEAPFNPNIRDGKSTQGLKPDKTNWANTIDTPPFEAYAVTCGITFTFGGLHITADAEVLHDDGEPIPGLYAAGELVGGIFYFNYPGGSGLTSGAVFGRIAGRSAAGAR